MILTKEKKASAYLQNRYDLSFITGVELGKLYAFKENLIKDHELNQLRTIKASINSQIEQYKQANLIITVVVFIVTLIFTMYNAFFSLAVKTIDWYPKNENNYSEISSAFNKSIQTAFKSNTNTLIMIAAILVVSLFIYLKRYKYIVLLNNILVESIEEKKEIQTSNEEN